MTASGLWAIWKELDQAFARSCRTLLIDANFNASIREERRYAGLFEKHVTMTVGLPLLIDSVEKVGSSVGVMLFG